jgi:hypothetical protein
MLHRFSLLLACAVISLRAETIQGTVIEHHSGDPLASAEVRLWKAGARGVLAETDTGTNGQFEFPNLAAGEYRIEVSKPNYTGANLQVTTDGKHDFPITVPLIRCGAISGTITDQQGRPVSDAYVFVISKPADGKVLRLQRVAGQYSRADDQGRFRIFHLRPGQYLVAVSYSASSIGSGTLLYPKIFEISDGEEFANTNFTLAPGTLASISGQVNIPTPGATVGRFWLSLTTEQSPILSIATTQAEQDGSFHFEGIPPGSYALLAAGPSTAHGAWGGIPGPQPLFGRIHVETGGQNLEGLSVSVQPGRSATLILRAPAQCPDTAAAQLSPIEDWGSSLDTTVDLTRNREKTVDHLAPGSYLVTLSVPGNKCFGPPETTVDLTRSSDKPIELIPVPASSIRGQLTGTTEPQAFSILLLDTDPLQEVVPDAQSHFTFSDLRPGRYRIAVRPSKGATTKPQEIEVQTGVPTEITLSAPL